LRLLETPAATGAVEPFGEAELRATHHAHEGASATLRERRLQRIHETGTRVLAGGQTVHEHEHVVARGRRRRIQTFEVERVFAREQAPEAALEEPLEQVRARDATGR